jgi:hypothetical protein
LFFFLSLGFLLFIYSFIHLFTLVIE